MYLHSYVQSCPLIAEGDLAALVKFYNSRQVVPSCSVWDLPTACGPHCCGLWSVYCSFISKLSLPGGILKRLFLCLLKFPYHLSK